MKNYIAIFLSCFMALTMLTGCYTHPHHNHKHKHKTHHKQKIHKSPRHGKHYGQVSNIEILILQATSLSEGAVLEPTAVSKPTVGEIVGHQMGIGRDVATGDGAVIANDIEKRNETDREIYRITVNVDNGNTLQFDYEEIEDLQIGDRVRIENGYIDLI